MTEKDDHALATLLVERLNEILEHDRDAISELVRKRVRVSADLAENTCCAVDGQQGDTTFLLGPIGLLNGLCGSAACGQFPRIITHLAQRPDGACYVTEFEARKTPPPYQATI